MDYKGASNEELERLVNSKDGEAICELGERCLHGTGGHEINLTRAYQLFHKGEKMGISRACAGLGEMYQKGLFFAPNERLAREYYQKAGIPYHLDSPTYQSAQISSGQTTTSGSVENVMKDTDIKSMLEAAETARGGKDYSRAKNMCNEVLNTIDQIRYGKLRYSGDRDVDEFSIAANWILAYTAFNEQDYSKMEEHLAVDGVYALHPWGVYLAAVAHRITNSPAIVIEQDVQMLINVKGNQNLSQEERGDICDMLGELVAEGYGVKFGIRAGAAKAYYEEAMNCGNVHAGQRYYEIN